MEFASIGIAASNFHFNSIEATRSLKEVKGRQEKKKWAGNSFMSFKEKM